MFTNLTNLFTRKKTMTNTNTIATFQEIELALEAANSMLPQLMSVIGAFYPPAAAFAKFLPLINVALIGVDTVAKATGNYADATTAVVNHLTPGQLNAPALN